MSADAEPLVRLGLFFAVFAVMAVWEGCAPRREQSLPRGRRWLPNLALGGLNSLLLRLAFPLGAIGAAAWAEARGIGLLAQVDLPAWAAIVVAIVVLDLAIYGQHVLFHKVPLLWRLHRLHHSDIDFDVTTALRFHPLEIALSMGIKMAVVLAIGAPPLAVVLFENILNGMAMFNHANARLPQATDRLLRAVVVTPDMHRVHHSILRRETDSNFGFNLSVWDRLFGTYRPAPRDGQLGMVIGLAEFRGDGDRGLGRLLLQPFRSTG